MVAGSLLSHSNPLNGAINAVAQHCLQTIGFELVSKMEQKFESIRSYSGWFNLASLVVSTLSAEAISKHIGLPVGKDHTFLLISSCLLISILTKDFLKD